MGGVSLLDMKVPSVLAKSGQRLKEIYSNYLTVVNVCV